MARRKLVAGNWKMHGVSADLGEVTRHLDRGRNGRSGRRAVPAGDTDRTRGSRGAGIRDRRAGRASVRTRARIPAAFLRRCCVDAGARLTIVGHSERREAQRESDADVKAKAERGLAAGLTSSFASAKAMRCAKRGRRSNRVGPARRFAARRRSAIPARFSVAYEPIWAIGTGKVPSIADIGEMHAALRGRLKAAYR